MEQSSLLILSKSMSPGRRQKTVILVKSCDFDENCDFEKVVILEKNGNFEKTADFGHIRNPLLLLENLFYKFREFSLIFDETGH